MRELLSETATRATRYMTEIGGRRVAPLLEGVGDADSWAIDCHKWLNVPYDSGIAVVRDPEHLRRALSWGHAAYLTQSAGREPWQYTPDASRRGGIELWAAMRSLGRSGLREMIERNCRQARLFADRLSAAGFTVLKEGRSGTAIPPCESPSQVGPPPMMMSSTA